MKGFYKTPAATERNTRKDFNIQAISRSSSTYVETRYFVFTCKMCQKVPEEE